MVSGIQCLAASSRLGEVGLGSTAWSGGEVPGVFSYGDSKIKRVCTEGGSPPRAAKLAWIVRCWGKCRLWGDGSHSREFEVGVCKQQECYRGGKQPLAKGRDLEVGWGQGFSSRHLTDRIHSEAGTGVCRVSWTQGAAYLR